MATKVLNPAPGSPAGSPGGSGPAVVSPTPAAPKAPKNPVMGKDHVIGIASNGAVALDNAPAVTHVKRVLTPADDAKVKKLNPYFDDKDHLGVKLSEDVGTTIEVDIDHRGPGRVIQTLNTTAPLYNIALTKETIKKVVAEGFWVRKSKKTGLEDTAYIEHSTGDLKWGTFKWTL